MSVKVSSKYQVVIPENARKSLELKPGSEVEVIVKGGIAYLIPVKSLHDIRQMVKGKLTPEDVKTVREKDDRNL